MFFDTSEFQYDVSANQEIVIEDKVYLKVCDTELQRNWKKE